MPKNNTGSTISRRHSKSQAKVCEDCWGRITTCNSVIMKSDKKFITISSRKKKNSKKSTAASTSSDWLRIGQPKSKSRSTWSREGKNSSKTKKSETNSMGKLSRCSLKQRPSSGENQFHWPRWNRSSMTPRKKNSNHLKKIVWSTTQDTNSWTSANQWESKKNSWSRRKKRISNSYL